MNQQTLLIAAAALCAAYYLWPSIAGWFTRQPAEVPEISDFTSRVTRSPSLTAEDAFDALNDLHAYYVDLGVPEEQIAELIHPHLPFLFRAPVRRSPA